MGLYDLRLNQEDIDSYIEIALSKYGKISKKSRGMCGAVYHFDQGERVIPRWVVFKTPLVPEGDREERHKRFLREMSLQHSYYSHRFVAWPADYLCVHGEPFALYRAVDGDLSHFISNKDLTFIGRLAILCYIIAAIKFCLSKGMICHQDIKPQNILIEDVRPKFKDLPDVDIYRIATLSDFGLTNAGPDLGVPDGPRPYMSPEQLLKCEVSSQSDVFSFGVLAYELLSFGRHPIGINIAEFWPVAQEGKSKKYTKIKVWERWARDGNPVKKGYLPEDLEDVVLGCLRSDPSRRPLLDEVLSSLLSAIKHRDFVAFKNVELLINFFNDESLKNNTHNYRDAQFDKFKNNFSRNEV